MTVDDLAPPSAVTDPLSPGADRRPAQRIERRKGLPTGRAVVGGLLVTLAALGVFWAYLESNDEPGDSYVVVAADLAPGERIEATDLRLEAIDLPADVAGQSFRSIDGVVGGIVIGPLTAGELLQNTDVVAPDDGQSPDDPAWREVSFLVADDHALGGRLRRGERVDLIATYADSGDSDTVVVFQDVLLLRVAEGDASGLGGDALIYTVALERPADVLATVNAVDSARSITLVRSTTSAGLELPGRFDGRDAPAEGGEGG